MKKTKSTTQSNFQRKEGFGMKKDQIKTVTNNQTARKKEAEQTPCNADMRKFVEEFLSTLGGTKGSSEITLMLSMAVTTDYLDSLDRDNLPEPEDAGSELLQKTVAATIACNEVLAENGDELPLDVPAELNAYQIARLILALYHVVQVPTSEMTGKYPDEFNYPGSGYTILYYSEEGRTASDMFSSGTYYFIWPFLIADICPAIRTVPSQLTREVSFWLHMLAEKAGLYRGQELLPVINGIINCTTKKLMPFSPDYVFAGKYDWEYVESGTGPVMRSIYDGTVSLTMEEWINEVRAEREAEKTENSEGGN